jgi:DNA repair exonuclease SbcCD ATPase subunit
MKLERLLINNFRSYENADLEFSPSQNYIFGRNWQGKSSIVDAIGFALFGRRTFPLRMAGSPVKAENIVREGADQGFVELRFEHDGKSYVLKRTCPRETVSLECDGAEVGGTSTTVSEYLTELLGVDKELFANVFYSEQDALRKVLEVTPEDRKTFVEAILGFEYLKEVKMSAKHASDSLLKWLDGFTSGNVKTILDMSKQLEKRVASTSNRVKELAELVSKYKDAPKLTSEALGRATKATTKLNKALEELSSVKTQKGFYSGLLEGVTTGVCPTCKQPVTGTAKTHAEHELKHLIDEIQGKIREADSEFKKFELELGRANSDMFKSQADETILSGYTSERDTLKAQFDEDREQLADLKRQLVAYENKDKVIKRINEETAFLDELQLAIDEFRTDLRKLMVTDLENAANFLLAKFSDGDFDAQLKITDDFGFQILLHNRPVPIFNLSGAARDILAIAVRYGLYRIASKEINFLLLDEPTHHFDQGNTAKFKQALNELAEQQLIVITVHDEFSDATGKKFAVEKDANLCSVVRELRA